MIYAMKQGYIMESGTHEECYHHGGTYKEILFSMKLLTLGNAQTSLALLSLNRNFRRRGTKFECGED